MSMPGAATGPSLGASEGPSDALSTTDHLLRFRNLFTPHTPGAIYLTGARLCSLFALHHSPAARSGSRRTSFPTLAVAAAAQAPPPAQDAQDMVYGSPTTQTRKITASAGSLTACAEAEAAAGRKCCCRPKEEEGHSCSAASTERCADPPPPPAMMARSDSGFLRSFRTVARLDDEN